MNPVAIYLAEWLCTRVKFIRRDRGRFSGGLLPVLPVCRSDRAERVRRGADNGCYGKSEIFIYIENRPEGGFS